VSFSFCLYYRFLSPGPATDKKSADAGFLFKSLALPNSVPQSFSECAPSDLIFVILSFDKLCGRIFAAIWILLVIFTVHQLTATSYTVHSFSPIKSFYEVGMPEDHKNPPKDQSEEEVLKPLETDIPNPARTKTKSWQDRMMPIMAGMLVALTLFFFIATFVQMSYLHWNILNSPPIQFDIASGDALIEGADNFVDLYEARQFEIRATMERFIVEKRYHQAGVLLMSGLWLRYLGFVTGMILALLGAAFVLGKLREPTQKLEGKFSDISLSISTASPGIILALLGVVLMFATLLDRDTYNVSDANVYLSVAAD